MVQRESHIGEHPLAAIVCGARTATSNERSQSLGKCSIGRLSHPRTLIPSRRGLRPATCAFTQPSHTPGARSELEENCMLTIQQQPGQAASTQPLPLHLKGKIAVVTGAGSGMGLAIATRFAAEGAAVVAGDWNGQRLDAAVANIQANGGTIVGAQGNIADQATAENLIDLALSTYGHLDVLCNNAGVMDYMQGVGELSDDI